MSKEKIIARGYHKFFNINERIETQLKNLTDENIKFPLLVFEKANGYLGLLSAYKNSSGEIVPWISSKTSISGEHAEHFSKMIKPFLTVEVLQKILSLNITLLFEVIDPLFDPHIEEYPKPELVLLNGVYNEIEFRLLDDDNTNNLLEILNGAIDSEKIEKIRKKKLITTINSQKELLEFINEVNKVKPFEKENYIEGYVFQEDTLNSPFMFKLKTDWYKYWKYMRSITDRFITKVLRVDENTSRSNLVLLKANLYTYEHHKYVNWLIERKNSFKEDEYKYSIIEYRKKFFKEKLREEL